MTDNYQEVCAFLEAQFSEVSGYDFYRELFPNNENSREQHTDFSHPNAIYLYKDEQDTKRKTLRRRVMLNDTWEEDYTEFVECNSMTLCSGLAYRRKTNKLENAQQMNALIFDLDGVGLNELRNLFYRFDKDPSIIRTLPRPTFLVASGGGLHLYYVFQDPIALYPNIKLQLKALKYDLTFRMWEYKATSQIKEIQYQSINQCFRMVGSTNAKHGTQLRAFRTGERVTLDYVNTYAYEAKNRVDINKPFRPSTMNREAAREKYPEWYQRVVIEGNKRQKKWDIKGKQGDALYKWWMRQLPKIKGGHRYFFLMCLAIYACKCDVPKAKLKKDMQEAFEVLDRIENRNPDGSIDPMKQEDIDNALEAYDKEYYNFTIADIEALTDIRIERNKRNGRKQAQHLKVARAIRDVLHDDWRSGNGRPSAEQKVREWQKQHPSGTKKQCKDDTGLTYPTIRKWWVDQHELLPVYMEDETEPAYYVTRAQAEEYSRSNWHKELPEHYVIDGDPNMFQKMIMYVAEGVRKVEVLTKEEHEELFANEVTDRFLNDY